MATEDRQMRKSTLKMPKIKSETKALIAKLLKTKKGRARMLDSMRGTRQLRLATLRPLPMGIVESFTLFSLVVAMLEKGEQLPEDLRDVFKSAFDDFMGKPSNFKPYEGPRPSIWDHLDEV